MHAINPVNAQTRNESITRPELINKGKVLQIQIPLAIVAAHGALIKRGQLKILKAALNNSDNAHCDSLALEVP